LRVRVVHVRGETPTEPAWYDYGGIEVTSVRGDSDPGTFEDVDCVVVEDDDGVDAMDAVWRLRATAPEAPIVVYPPAGTGSYPLVFGGGHDGVRVEVPPESSPDTAAFGAFLIGLVTDDVDGQEVAKTDALHDAAMELVYCETEAEAFEYAVEAATNLLELEMASIYTVDGSKLVPAATGGDEVIPPSEVAVFDVDEGAVGHVYRTGESLVVEDTDAHEIAEPTAGSIRSGVCISLGEIGTLVAIDDEVGAFDERDRTLLEILGAHVRTAVDRLRTRSAIERERDRFVALFEHVPDPLVVAEPTPNGPRIRHANPAFEDTFGVESDEVEGDIAATHIGLPDDAERIDVPENGYVAEEISREGVDGVREFLFRGFPVEVGGDTRHVAIFTDVTEKRRQRRELERKTERLEEFASIVSHDLRNPLGVAKGWVEQGKDDPEHAERAIREVETSLDRMDSLVEDLLSLSREGWEVDRMAPVEARPLVQRAWDGLDTGGATLSIEWSGTVLADRDMAVELFENLFRNAVEHGSGDDPDSEVAVTVAPLVGEDGVFVADDGPGLSPELRESAFEMGVTSDDDGTGLGLAIVDRIAEAHGWEVTATESESGGARFEVRFSPEER
jgi:PAS domain S-box-containing protein